MLCFLSAWVIGCDLIAKEGDELVLDGDLLILGSFAPPGEQQAVPAARVLQGGSLLVKNASLLGGNARVGSIEQLQFPNSAIVATGGRICVESGLIRGGELAFTRQLNTFVGGFPGIFASDSRIEVSGGTIAGGPAAEFLPAEPPGGGGATGGSAIIAERCELSLTGGVLRSSPNTQDAPLDTAPSLVARDSTFDISGGDLRSGPVELRGSRGRISGGLFGVIEATGANCVEIRGGTLRSIRADGGDDVQVVVFGTSFSQPTGMIRTRNGARSLRLTGVLADGSPLDVRLSLEGSPSVVLSPPTGRGCL